jgi:hypothetical protein
MEANFREAQALEETIDASMNHPSATWQCLAAVAQQKLC